MMVLYTYLVSVVLYLFDVFDAVFLNICCSLHYLISVVLYINIMSMVLYWLKADLDFQYQRTILNQNTIIFL
jgi:hypothetical protein